MPAKWSIGVLPPVIGVVMETGVAVVSLTGLVNRVESLRKIAAEGLSVAEFNITWI